MKSDVWLWWLWLGISLFPWLCFGQSAYDPSNRSVVVHGDRYDWGWYTAGTPATWTWTNATYTVGQDHGSCVRAWGYGGNQTAFWYYDAGNASHVDLGWTAGDLDIDAAGWAYLDAVTNFGYPTNAVVVYPSTNGEWEVVISNGVGGIDARLVNLTIVISNGLVGGTGGNSLLQTLIYNMGGSTNVPYSDATNTPGATTLAGEMKRVADEAEKHKKLVQDVYDDWKARGYFKASETDPSKTIFEAQDHHMALQRGYGDMAASAHGPGSIAQYLDETAYQLYNYAGVAQGADGVRNGYLLDIKNLLANGINVNANVTGGGWSGTGTVVVQSGTIQVTNGVVGVTNGVQVGVTNAVQVGITNWAPVNTIPTPYSTELPERVVSNNGIEEAVAATVKWAESATAYAAAVSNYVATLHAMLPTGFTTNGQTNVFVFASGDNEAGIVEKAFVPGSFLEFGQESNWIAFRFAGFVDGMQTDCVCPGSPGLAKYRPFEKVGVWLIYMVTAVWLFWRIVVREEAAGS